MNIDKERELFEECLISKTNLVTDGLVNWDESIGKYKGVKCHEIMAGNINFAYEIWLDRAAIAPEWISVEDELPKEGQKVIAQSPYGINSICFNGESFGDSRGMMPDVTHWQPLPQVKELSK